MVSYIIAWIPITVLIAWCAWAVRKGKLSRGHTILLSAFTAGIGSAIASWTIDGDIWAAIAVGLVAAIGISLGMAVTL